MLAKQNIWNMWNIVMHILIDIAYERNYLPRIHESNTYLKFQIKYFNAQNIIYVIKIQMINAKQNGNYDSP